MPDATFACPDLTTFTRLDELGLVAVGQRLEPDRAVIACRVVEPDQWCRRCGAEGVGCGTVVRRLAHEPFGWRPTTLLIRDDRTGSVLPISSSCAVSSSAVKPVAELVDVAVALAEAGDVRSLASA